MPKIAVVTDSSALLPSDLANQYDIRTAPLTVIWGTDTYLDGVEITPPEFYRRLREHPIHPSTTQPNPEDFIRLFDELAKDYSGIVVPLISSELNGSVSSASIAAEQFANMPIRIVDTRTAAMGLGFSVLAAARAASSGKSIDEVEQNARTVASMVKVFFVADTLKFLHKGGKISGAARLLGTVFALKHLFHLNEGRVDALERVRTKRKAVERMVELAQQYVNETPVRASIMHANALREGEALKKKVAKLFRCSELHLTELSPVIAANTGPGTLGLAIFPDGFS
jgi:DegV family protein with EDD domain